MSTHGPRDRGGRVWVLVRCWHSCGLCCNLMDHFCPQLPGSSTCAPRVIPEMPGGGRLGNAAGFWLPALRCFPKPWFMHGQRSWQGNGPPCAGRAPPGSGRLWVHACTGRESHRYASHGRTGGTQKAVWWSAVGTHRPGRSRPSLPWPRC